MASSGDQLLKNVLKLSISCLGASDTAGGHWFGSYECFSVCGVTFLLYTQII